MVGHFYDAKCREQVQRHSAYTQGSTRPARGGTLTVCDSGAAIANSVADQLSSAPLASQTG